MFRSTIAANQVHVAVIKFPSGKFGYAGFKIPGELMYTDSPERIKQMREASCPQFLHTRAFNTEQEAEAALADWLEAHPEYTNTCTKG
jgi:hypothetical protein